MAITPASGFVLPGAALLIGLVAGGVCYWMVTEVKPRFGYDDSLDAFGVHGVGGGVGMLLTGVLATGALSADAAQPAGAFVAGLHLLAVQALGVGAAIAWSASVTWALLKLVEALVGLRVSEEDERRGLDEVLHGESLG